MKMVITDLDGTLFQSHGKVSVQNVETLKRLGEKGVVRVVATGRSLYVAQLALPPDFPIDYLIFSCGAGLLEWKTKRLLTSHHLDGKQTSSLADYLNRRRVDYMVHDPIPDNHRFTYFETGLENPDFVRRCEKHRAFCRRGDGGAKVDWEAAQFIVILPPHHGSQGYEGIRRELPDYAVIRTTSPLDSHSVWIEIFRRNVSKSFAGSWLCDLLGIGVDEVVAVGNDYNDLDLLDWAGQSFVIANSPNDLRVGRRLVGRDDQTGFAEAVMLASSVQSRRA